MTNSEQAIREKAINIFADIFTAGGEAHEVGGQSFDQLQQSGYIDRKITDLTALISEHYVSKDEHEAIAKMAEALKADMNAAKLELALMRKFILWTGENCQYYPDVNEWMYFESPMTQQYFKGTDELFNYWEENCQ